MSKTFTLGEAQTLLPVLESLLQRARSSALHAAELELEMQRLSHRIFLSGGMHVDVVAAARRRAERDKATQETQDTIAEIEAIGARVQNLEDGVLDFPCQVEGRAALLCWKMGEVGISHWHGVDESAEQRRPLDGRLGKSERLN
ncbi:DUF2203 family protein [Granulicella sp. dw_53]|uniref:DUF2203 domain-containing protein n=1 Tax=Granulicella sp. dw_53 TaxID=2719792 RepID=UPI001BD3632C